MRDIVKRLRLRRDPLTDGERAEAADEIERLRAENNVLASLLTCWLDPMLQGEDRWAISAETLEQLLKATKKALESRQ
jgi:hypothetical protein